LETSPRSSSKQPSRCSSAPSSARTHLDSIVSRRSYRRGKVVYIRYRDESAT
jgi:hypothetical protein